MAPKVFISHASEDKQRFVVAFARRLRENGVDAWLDQWEMQPGDSLVDKIFEQGLKEANAVIIVLSAASVRKPWVREELNLSVVKRVSKGIKLIPVVIDPCEIPESLQSTLWQRIDDLEQYDDAFQRILSAIFDTPERPTSGRPELGQPPQRFSAPPAQLTTLTRVDELALRAVARQIIDLQAGIVTFQELMDSPELADVPAEALHESLQILEQQEFVSLERSGADPPQVALTLPGFRQFAATHIEDYPTRVAQISGLLVNEAVIENREIAERIGRPLAFVNFVLDALAAEGHIKIEKYGGGLWEVWQIAPSLKRSLT